MTNSPFPIVLVITGFLLIASVTAGVLAPYVGEALDIDLNIPEAPVFPNLPNLAVQGNFSVEFPFDETHQIYARGNVKYTAFSPDKAIEFQSLTLFAPQYFTIERFGADNYIPWWYIEQVYTTHGQQVVLTAENIINAYDGSVSLFIVDYGSPYYEAYVAFSPLTGYSSIYESWNSGEGFTCRMYGQAYSEPDWLTSAGAYLGWFGSTIAYFVYFLAYIIVMAGTLFTLLGLAPALSGGVIILIVIAFCGSILMFIRGSAGGGK